MCQSHNTMLFESRFLCPTVAMSAILLSRIELALLLSKFTRTLSYNKPAIYPIYILIVNSGKQGK